MDLERQQLSILQKRQVTENSARAAAKIALAELQLVAGTDSVVTAECISDAGTYGWHGVWGARNPPTGIAGDVPLPAMIPLVTHAGNFSRKEAFYMTNPKSGEQVPIPWDYVGENLRLAYCIFDESQKASISQFESDEYLASFSEEELQELRQLSNRELGFEKIFKNVDVNSIEFRNKLKVAPYDLSALFSAFPEAGFAKNSITRGTFGVLSDWPRNVLKSDLSDREFSDNIFPARFVREHLNGDSKMGVPVVTAPAESHGKYDFQEAPFPVVVELRLHVGCFNTRSDGQHRARFHVSAKLWNPYAFPLLAHGDGNLGLLDFNKMPSVSISNLDTGAGFSFGMSDFQQKRFGIVSQTSSDKTFNADCKIFDASDLGFGVGGRWSDVGLYPGEVFLGVYPNPDGQPEGLSRITGGETWRYQKKEKSKKPPSGANGNRWFHPFHSIQVTLLPSIVPSEFSFRHYNGDFGQHTFPQNYSESILKFKNLRLPGGSFTLSGAEYNRAESPDYDITQANFVYRIRLKTEDSAALAKFLETHDFRGGTLDFSRPEVEAAFEVSVHFGNEARELAHSEDSHLDSYLFDKYKNSHKINEPDSFACVPVFDKPSHRNFSVGAFRYFHCLDCRQHKLGSHLDERSEKQHNEILDRYFISGEHEKLVPENHNPHFITTRGQKKPKSEDAATYLLARGVFNINSTDALVWEAVLSNNVLNWSKSDFRKSGASNHVTRFQAKDLKNVFFLRPFSAHMAFYGAGLRDYSDADLEALEKNVRERVLLSQGFRALTDEKLAALAGEIATRVQEHIRNAGPFKSLGEFADSGIIRESLEVAGVNILAGEKIPEWFPGFITQGHILQALAFTASPRGDTFKIIACAETINPITRVIEGRAVAEMRVQRIPEFFDATQSAGTLIKEQNAKNKFFGRRFKIVNFNLINHDEI